MGKGQRLTPGCIPLILRYDSSMSGKKERLTVTVDPAFVKVGLAAVKRGAADSLSAWVNGALAAQVKEERRLAALNEAIAAYEARHGRFTEEELAEQERQDRANAIRYPRRRTRRRKAA